MLFSCFFVAVFRCVRLSQAIRSISAWMLILMSESPEEANPRKSHMNPPMRHVSPKNMTDHTKTKTKYSDPKTFFGQSDPLWPWASATKNSTPMLLTMLPWLFWASMYCNSKLSLRSSKFVVGATTVCHHFALWNTYEYIASSCCLLQSRVASESELLDVLFPGNTWQHILASTHTSAFHHDECTKGCRSPTGPSRQICTIDNEYQWIVLINAAKFIQGPNQ